ncbi:MULTISPECIES: cytochrome-c peroxidase [unclassified Polaribacter]|uniref:cytochrome-c peroxidase n=1 Tax=unclassified Polaribacter TaxID=196858 RepID=UPI0011BD845F|nr:MULTISPECIES: cytochrome c peroxidase [unclassified Polaribacter]TXD53525.1 cytochrome-c peroxidase [Polaribacter sp. IC063]TXD58597.1 cytochrome-c peroxidase [Polaribacter sp. IC066]
MKKIVFLVLTVSLLFNCKKKEDTYTDIRYLREVYAQTDTSKWPAPMLDSLIDKSKFQDIGLLPKVKFPEDNPYSKEKKELGKFLFFDARLSKTGQVACASCHNPELGWTDNITRSFGHDRLTSNRNAMTIKNVAFAHTLFWDGRSSSLEDQASFPISDPAEMNTDTNIAVNNIDKITGYKTLFKKAFGNEEVTLDRILKAIATYERTIVSRNSKFDRFIKGKKELFTDEEVLGLHLFRTKARCLNCHNTPYFSDNQFHNDGQALFGTKDEDFGKYYATKNLDDLGKFKTPTLREVSETGPWMHHGHFPTLLDVVEFYNLGNPAPIQKRYVGKGRDSLIPKTSTLLKRLDLTREEVKAVIAFMETLSTRTQRVNISKMPKE